jgi:hypothetical protein
LPAPAASDTARPGNSPSVTLTKFAAESNFVIVDTGPMRTPSRFRTLCRDVTGQ